MASALSIRQLQTTTGQATAVLGIAVLTLAAAYASQYLGGLEPCPLCLYQRWPWWIAIGLSAAALLPVLAANARRLLLAMAGLSILTGAGIALYHVGVEQHWWAGPAACGSGGPVPGSLAELGRMMNQPVPRCDEPAWSLFGISMAGYNGLLSLAVGAWALGAALFGLAGRRSAFGDG